MENTLQRSQRQRSPAIVVAAMAWEWFHMIATDRWDRFFFSAIAAITAMVVIIWKPGFNFIMAYFKDFKRKDCLQRNLYFNCVSLWKALKASDIVLSVSISAVNHIIKEATCDPGIRISRFQGEWSITRYLWGGAGCLRKLKRYSNLPPHFILAF